MTTILVFSGAFLLMGLGLIGCFVHKVPGPILAFLGILLLQYGTGNEYLSVGALVTMAVLVVLAKVLSKYIPKVVEKIHEVSKAGTWGSILGSILGLILLAAIQTEDLFPTIMILVLGFVILPFALSFLFSLIKVKNGKEALLEGAASYLTYLMGVILNLGVCLWCIYAAFTGN